MGDISLTLASLVSLWMETLFYGGYAVLYFICMYILLYSRRRQTSMNKAMVFTATAMFLLSTAHIVIGLVRALKAFVDSSDGALEYYSEIWNWLSIFKQALYATNNILADGLVVYRCYIVWNYDYKIITVPIIMLLSTTVCAYLAVYNFSQVHPGDNVFSSNIAGWGTALFSLSLATNIIVTTLIASRIWWISREAASNFGRRYGMRYNQAFAIVIESGAIYSLSLCTLLILYCQRTNAQYIAYDSLAQIMGIVPTMIIVRVGLGISTQDVTSYATSAIPGRGGPRAGAVPMPLAFRRQTVNDATFSSVDDSRADVGASKVEDLIPEHHSSSS